MNKEQLLEALMKNISSILGEDIELHIPRPEDFYEISYLKKNGEIIHTFEDVFTPPIEIREEYCGHLLIRFAEMGVLKLIPNINIK